MAGCEESLLDQLSLRLSEGERLEREVESLGHVSGSCKLVKKIRQELKFLQKHRDTDLKQLKKEHLDCTNLTHLGSIVAAIRTCHEPCDTLKPFQYRFSLDTV